LSIDDPPTEEGCRQWQNSGMTRQSARHWVVGPQAARGESPAAFDGRCIPARGVAHRSFMPN